jgi:membrane associated rhomboid family serine protease
MLFPIGDDNSKRKQKPAITLWLIGANVIIFLLEWTGVIYPIEKYALIPSELASGEMPIQNIFWSMFLHGGWMHLGFNMLYLYIFGDNVEDNLGRSKFLLFYLLCGAGAGLSHGLLYPDSHIPMIGASGAIMGVLGGYIFLYPKNQIKMFAYGCLFSIRAWIAVGLYMFLEFFSGLSEYRAYQTGGDSGDDVAHIAHIGGFLTGVLVVVIFRRRGSGYSDEELREVKEELSPDNDAPRKRITHSL